MKYIPYEELKNTFEKILLKKGFDEETSSLSAKLFADNSLDGIYSHGVNRFPRVMSYLEKGYINPKAKPEVISSFGATERWDGKLAMGNTNAYKAMDRAIELAEKFGVGVVAIGNTNHWMRGGTYGLQAADRNMIGICWTNTMPNMPAWGTKVANIGNNPFVMAIPRENKEHLLLDCAMAQFSYGKMEDCRLKGQKLPVVGGYDEEGNLTDDPGAIEKTWRALPIGFWKGSGLSIVLDLVAATLAGGYTTSLVGKKCEEEYGISQVLMALNPKAFGTFDMMEDLIKETEENIKNSPKAENTKEVFLPGQFEIRNRYENMKNSIPVVDEVWDKILSFL